MNDDESLLEAFTLAENPRYLGNPEVVAGILAEYVLAVIGVYNARGTDGASAAYKAKEAAGRKATVILSGEDPEYPTIGSWHSVEGLGERLVQAMNLDRDYCSDEPLSFIVSEAIPALSIKANAMLAAFKQHQTAAWDEHTEMQFQELIGFVTSVFLGTNDVVFPGRDLSSFSWRGPD